MMEIFYLFVFECWTVSTLTPSRFHGTLLRAEHFGTCQIFAFPHSSPPSMPAMADVSLLTCANSRESPFFPETPPFFCPTGRQNSSNPGWEGTRSTRLTFLVWKPLFLTRPPVRQKGKFSRLSKLFFIPGV